MEGKEGKKSSLSDLQIPARKERDVCGGGTHTHTHLYSLSPSYTHAHTLTHTHTHTHKHSHTNEMLILFDMHLSLSHKKIVSISPSLFALSFFFSIRKLNVKKCALWKQCWIEICGIAAAKRIKLIMLAIKQWSISSTYFRGFAARTRWEAFLLNDIWQSAN